MRLVSGSEPIVLGQANSECDVSLLSLANEWQRWRAHHYGSGLWVSDAINGIHGGMSAPIMDISGKAIGIVSAAGGPENTLTTSGGPNPNLWLHLPGWALSLCGICS